MALPKRYAITNYRNFQIRYRMLIWYHGVLELQDEKIILFCSLIQHYNGKCAPLFAISVNGKIQNLPQLAPLCLHEVLNNFLSRSLYTVRYGLGRKRGKAAHRDSNHIATKEYPLIPGIYIWGWWPSIQRQTIG